MLVVSRKQNQSVVFPTLGISVEILRVAGKTVRVGFQAPDEIPILRGELSRDAVSKFSTGSRGKLTEQENHDLKNRLNQVSLAMSLLQKQLAAGNIDDAEESLAIALDTFHQMEQAVSTPGAVPPVASLDPGSADQPAQRKRALLVEDDPNERMLLASYLRASGYEVDTAEDGQAALEYLADRKPDAVVMDMEMPRLNGRDCVSRIRSDCDFDDMKLFVVSGMEQQSMQVPTGDRGIQRWFSKPLSPEDLVNELATSLN